VETRFRGLLGTIQIELIQENFFEKYASFPMTKQPYYGNVYKGYLKRVKHC
jgi:hypothetical protein